MKKSLFFAAAASALMLTACSSENDVVQNAPQTKEATAQAVGFDVYTPAATEVTRAGQAGTMTTSRLQRSALNGGGFGVYAYLVEDVNATSGDDNASSYLAYGDGPTSARTTPFAPNYMVNEKITWNKTNMGWEYAPIKYWPNETDNDSQNTKAQMEGFTGDKHLDRLTFFAYAPYVSGTNTEIGVTKVTDKDGKLGGAGDLIEASVEYKASLDDPNASVDLLWGVAPSGGLSYTAVNGRTVNVPEGQPLMDMTKPGVNTSMKFLFNHALARIGINVVAAVDQLGAGGNLHENTKITVANVTLTGKFGETGVLNLDNPTPNIAHWVNINGTDITATAPTADKTLEIPLAKIAPSLRFEGTHDSPAKQTVTGVTTTKQDLLAGRYYALDEVPAYSPAKQYYSNAEGTVAIAKYTPQASENIYTYETSTYTQKTTQIPATGTYYRVVAGEKKYDGNNVKTAAVYYDATTAAEYNATLTGAKHAGDLKTDAIPYADVDDYNADHDPDIDATAFDALPAEDKIKTDATYYDATTAAEYNATLPGHVSAGELKDEAVYGYSDDDLSSSTILYSRTGTEGSYSYTYVGTKNEASWGATDTHTYCTITPTALAVTDIPFAYTESTIYDVERNYFMVVPTDNVKRFLTSLDKDVEEGLRTIRVKIEYYITTEDDKLAGGLVQTKNVIEKDVVFPSLANGKSYMLNLVLGLTSVKMDAEVDEWKVVNVNGDLPQNTAE